MPSVPGVVRVSDQRQNRKSVRLSLPVYQIAARLRCWGFFRAIPSSNFVRFGLVR